jgi:fatty acid CoA ligase FadD22
VKGPSLPTGYLDAEPSSGSAFLDGWFKSGDRACRLPEGRFRHLGRVDDMLMVGGIKISPVHVESVLGNHPDVVDVAVATEWEQGRSRLVAFVVSERELAETERELREYAKQRLARYMVPQRYVKVRELPRTTSGKLRRHLLRSAHWLTMARVEESPERQRTAKAEVDHA